MDSLADILYAIDDAVWGTPMTVILIGTGILLSARFGFRYQRKVGFNARYTYGKILEKESGEGEGTISGFRAACTALANTIGTRFWRGLRLSACTTLAKNP